MAGQNCRFNNQCEVVIFLRVSGDWAKLLQCSRTAIGVDFAACSFMLYAR